MFLSPSACLLRWFGTGRPLLSDFRAETHSHPNSLAASCRGFAFCLADPIGSAADFEQIFTTEKTENTETTTLPGSAQQLLLRDANDLVQMFRLFDRVEHECRNRFAIKRESHPWGGVFAASIGCRIVFGKTWRPSDRPIKTV